MTEWEPALNALEEWVRRTLDALATRDLELPPPPPALPTTPVPTELRLRAQVLLDRLHSTETEGLRRRTQLTQSQAYGAA
jgi:hypothetical protein